MKRLSFNQNIFPCSPLRAIFLAVGFIFLLGIFGNVATAQTNSNPTPASPAVPISTPQVKDPGKPDPSPPNQEDTPNKTPPTQKAAPPPKAKSRARPYKYHNNKGIAPKPVKTYNKKSSPGISQPSTPTKKLPEKKDVKLVPVKGAKTTPKPTATKAVQLQPNPLMDFKAYKFQASLFYGSLINENYISTMVIGGRFSYFLHERLAVESGYNLILNEDNQDKIDLKKISSSLGGNAKVLVPDINYIKSAVDAIARFSLFLSKIYAPFHQYLYFDISVLGGVSLVSTTQGSAWAPTFGIAEQVFFGEEISIQVELLDRLIQEKKGFPKQAVTRNLLSATVSFSMFL